MCRGSVTAEERQDMCQRHMQESKEQGQYMYRGETGHTQGDNAMGKFKEYGDKHPRQEYLLISLEYSILILLGK